jgi:hypothetical protein
VASGGSVDDDEVPAPPPPGVDGTRLVEDLAEHQRLGERGDDSQEEAHQPVLEDRLVDRPDLHHHERVLLQGVLGADVDGEQVGERLPDRGPGRRGAEQRRHPLLGVHLGHEHAPAPPAGHERQRRRHRGLPHASLARDDEETAIEKRAAGHGA